MTRGQRILDADKRGAHKAFDKVVEMLRATEPGDRTPQQLLGHLEKQVLKLRQTYEPKP